MEAAVKWPDGCFPVPVTDVYGRFPPREVSGPSFIQQLLFRDFN